MARGDKLSPNGSKVGAPEEEPDFEELIEFEMEQLPEDLVDTWRDVFEKNPKKYPTLESKLIAIRKVRDFREGRVVELADFQYNETLFDTPEQKKVMEDAAREAIKMIGDMDFRLGEGLTAEVFQLEKRPNICIKVITHLEEYRSMNEKGSGNTIEAEAAFLRQVENMIVEGVRAPHYYFFVPGDSIAYCMEALDAHNTDMVLTGRAKVENKELLDPEKFSDALVEYVKALHAMDIVHADLAPRNIMVDRKTLSPRVIDFGKAKQISLLSLEQQESLKKQDLENARNIAQKLQDFLDGVILPIKS